jgi:apolipoprotein N-acyltransferase
MQRLEKWQRYALSSVSGLLLVLSFPFTGSLTFLAFVAWVPLLLVEHDMYTRRLRPINLFWQAYLCFLIYNIGTTWWIWFASPGGAVMAFVLNALLMSGTFFLFHIIKKKQGKILGYLAFFTCWIGFEYAHHYWELSWPWLTLGNVFSIQPHLIQWYSLTGITGGTLWILLVNFVFLKWIVACWIGKESLKKQSLLVTILVALVIIPCVASYWMYSTQQADGTPRECVVVQPNIDPYKEKFSAAIDSQVNKIMDLANQKVTQHTALVVAPETALSQGFFEDELQAFPFFTRILKKKESWKNTYLFMGASTAKKFRKMNSRASRPLDGGFYEAYNSSILLEPDNQYSFHHKSKLVLGVEKLPFSDWFPFLEKLSIENGGTSGTLGVAKSPEILRTSHFSFAPLICYESIYGEFCAEQCRKGAEAIVVITNDGWWRDTPGYKQHMSFSRLRAIENHRYVIRSANTGISCFINSRGDIMQQTGWWKPAVLKGTLFTNNETTFFSRYGDLLGRASMVATLIVAVFSLIQTFWKTNDKR